MALLQGFPLKKSGLAFSIAYFSCSIYAEEVQPDREVSQLDTIVVHADANRDVIKHQRHLAETAGATNFIAQTELEHKKSTTLADVFQLQAGVYAQSAGNEGVKISVRGSGINRAPGAHASGLFTLLDDIPFTGPGGTPYELLEPWWIDHISVYKGANGFRHGALALGGALNYASPTGQNASGHEIRYEMGSHGYQKYLISSAGQQGALDYYVALTASEYSGFQQHSSGDSQGLMLNIGYEVSPDVDTRFYLRYRETEHESPGRITQAQLKANPKTANAYNILHDAKRIQPGSLWLANQTAWQLDNHAQLQASLAYHHYPMDLQESPYRVQVDYQDLTAKLVYEKPYEWLNQPQKMRIALRSTTHLPQSESTEKLRRDQVIDQQLYPADRLVRRYFHLGTDNVLQMEQLVQIHPKLQLEAGLAGIYTERHSRVSIPKTTGRVSLNKWHLAPRLGTVYQYNDDIQWFANLSRSIEPAHPWSLIWSGWSRFPSGSGIATGRQDSPIELKPQTANTVEIGGRGDHDWGNWALSYYYAQVKNELLSMQVNQANIPVYIAEINASHTIHQGLELSLHTPIYDFASYGQLSLDQSYTYSHFYYQHDQQLGKNELAGIPPHYYQAKLRFEHPLGYSMALNTEYAAKMPVDYANSRYSDAYHIWGLNFAYTPEHGKWQTWLDLRNVGNQIYATTVTPSYDDQGADAAHFTPSAGFTSYAGVTWKF